ncbi:MAG: Asp-tRNA(Asn)/Glu-tRNA(Gln) amidotransferase subunit GatC, partial [Eubacteriales bacterium]|nr:Asp-tRNA(Asn)/Glu-tRNA(Gln) amidotransferase subunit GatC [Eubacteriales bacterium]
APGEVTDQQLEDVHLLGSGSAIAGRVGIGSAAARVAAKRSVFGDAQALNQIALTDEEEIRVKEIFGQMKEYEKKLADIHTEDTEPMVHVMPMTNVLREDARAQEFSRESLLVDAPARSEDSWKVPRLVK